MRIFGVDPGPKKSGWCILYTDPVLMYFGHDWNRVVLDNLRDEDADALGYEWIQNYGGVVGEDVFRTCYMCGRLRQVFNPSGMDGVYEPTRPQIIKHFTGRPNLPKPEVRKVLRSRFGEHNAELLRGITNHAWDALAVCLFILESVYEYDEKHWAHPSSGCTDRLRNPF